MLDKMLTLSIIGIFIGVVFYFLTNFSFKRSVFFGIIGAIIGGLIAESFTVLINSKHSPMIYGIVASGIGSVLGNLNSKKLLK